MPKNTLPISVIIPIYNEEKALSENRDYYSSLSAICDLIFVDGGSVDGSMAAVPSSARTRASPKGRGIQMNHGASNARNDVLFFLHADTRCRQSALLSIRRAIDQGASGGCLTQRIDHNATIYRHIESKGNRVARKKKTFFGDFGIFVRKDVFEKLGGFPAIPIMEDLVFSKKMRKTGKIAVLDDLLLVSPRRWEQGGVLRTMLLHNILHFLFFLKVPPALLKRLYVDLR